MKKEVIEKIPNGKLLRIKVTFEDNIENVDINGDYFAYPESMIADFESCFENIVLNFEEEEKINELNAIIEKQDGQLIGIDIPSIIKLIKQAIQ